jgi:hypothetical protein
MSDRTPTRALAWVGREAKAHPLRTALCALGAGYVVGGGLFSPLTARLAGLGTRLLLRGAALPLVAQSLVTMLPAIAASPSTTSRKRGSR